MNSVDGTVEIVNERRRYVLNTVGPLPEYIEVVIIDDGLTVPVDGILRVRVMEYRAIVTAPDMNDIPDIDRLIPIPDDQRGVGYVLVRTDGGSPSIANLHGMVVLVDRSHVKWGTQ